MDLCMFSRSHFFQLKRRPPMSKRIQERKKEEELAVVKPRSMCLISTNLHREQSSSFDPDVSNTPENPQLDPGSVKGAAGNCERDIVHKGAEGNCRRDVVQNRGPNQESCSQVLKGDNQSQRSCGKLPRSTARAPCLPFFKGAAGNCVRNYVQCNMLKSSRVAGNCNKRLTSNYRRPGGTNITCKSQITGTLRKSSRFFVEN